MVQFEHATRPPAQSRPEPKRRSHLGRICRHWNAFKKIDNHVHALALHYFHYNFIRKHQTRKTTPAVAAGLANAPMTILDLVQMIETEESKLKGRLTDYLPARDSK